MENSDPGTTLAEWSAKIGATVSVLQEWDILYYSGHFIDADPEMKERIDATHERTVEVLKKWGWVITQKVEKP